MNDTDYMRRAIELAKRGEGGVTPNPLVGAVIVKDGQIIGEGADLKYGSLHAERNAIKDAKEKGNDLRGATIYVTLEPCCHHGHQPPCTEAIVEKGIKRVVIGSRDPNPLVHGKGAAFLKEHGIEVVEDFLRAECDELNAVFFHYITTKTPYVVMKCAESLDGKIATVTGESKYISCEESRRSVMRMRNKYKAIMIGIGTALADDPMLTCRLTEGKTRNPIRIVCDKNLRLPLESNLVKTANEVPTIIACSNQVTDEAAGRFQERGITLIRCPLKKDEIDLTFLMKRLGEMEIDGILLEGGSTLNASMLEAGLVNEVHLFIAPMILGGRAKTIVEGDGVKMLSDAYRFSIKDEERCGSDIHLTLVR